MLKKLRRWGLKALSFLLSDKLANQAARRISRPLVEQIRTRVTDDFIELLLKAMDIAFCLSRSYRENIRDFNATYVFTTADGKVGATASFKDGDMRVDRSAADESTVRVTFTDAAALRSFLFSTGQDILDSILHNQVEVRGNVNYVYKFGYMARNLEHRLGIA